GAKRAASPYTGGGAGEWIKIKWQRRQEFVVGGYTDPQGSRGYFGALHIGLYDEGRLVYVSKVGTGFDQSGLKSLWQKLQPLERPTPPFEAGAIPPGPGHHWGEPKPGCGGPVTDRANDGRIRH